MSDHRKPQIWPDLNVGCNCGACGWEAPEPDEEVDGTPQDGGITDDYNSISYPWNQPERDYWTENKDRKAEERP